MTGFANKSFLERIKLALKDKEELKVPALIKEGSSAQKIIDPFQLTLNPERTILLLSTPFFGQGQISYEGIKNCVRHVNSYLS